MLVVYGNSRIVVNNLPKATIPAEIYKVKKMSDMAALAMVTSPVVSLHRFSKNSVMVEALSFSVADLAVLLSISQEVKEKLCKNLCLLHLP